jgi:hypothetical protein
LSVSLPSSLPGPFTRRRPFVVPEPSRSTPLTRTLRV